MTETNLRNNKISFAFKEKQRNHFQLIFRCDVMSVYVGYAIKW